MGKGYNNFMSKKAFHPGSYANQKRAQEAVAKTEAKRKHDEETLAQYKKEQELFSQKSLLSNQSKEKLSLSFMYEAPPGVEKKDNNNNKKIGGEKVEWLGSGSSKGLTDAHSSVSGNNSKGEPTICLEWKRDKPVKNSAQAQKQDVKQEKLVKIEPVESKPKIEPKVEPKIEAEQQIDLKWKREKHSKITFKNKSSSSTTKYREDRDIKPDIKRIKKER